MRRRAVEVEVILLHVLAMIALAVGEAEQALLQDGVRSVPQRQREAQRLAVVGDPREAVLAPSIRARTRLVVREVTPRVPAAAVVLAHRPPLALAEIRPPLLP